MNKLRSGFFEIFKISLDKNYRLESNQKLNKESFTGKEKQGDNMSRDPFDEFRKIEEMFRKMLNSNDLSMGGTSRGISVQKIGNNVKVDVHGDISERELERLKRKYPDAEISVNGEQIEGSAPVEVLDEEDPKETKGVSGGEKLRQPEIEEVDEEEVDPGELALRRFKEKKKEEPED
ncbi:hypothetical protein AKJ40_03600 [candidate division MSBL1 archaeon SCGC-AAA259M10]|uniref:Uncharacterized protein n=2 Tax=candidate division MSBL1 TaxID=215777 RepID=A0A133UT57_9EURY|nr:hypothetical protein AKJ38_01450 [candidate division MSBL1 archaeon SCGC-AAA259I14]KXA99249.1 hypothetical protein AKJ40_03600 [candidate division MSBL1 archaeon SCGC-AAA259M10]